MDTHAKDLGARKAQRLLACEVLELVHGLEEAQVTNEMHQRMRTLTVEDVISSNTIRSRERRKRIKEAKANEEAAIEAAQEDTAEIVASEEPAKAKKSGKVEEPTEPEEPGLGEQHIILAESKVLSLPFSNIMQNAGLASSLSEAKRMISGGGVYVARRVEEHGSQELNFVPVKSLAEDVKVEDLLIERRLVLRLGKWKVRVVQVMDDSVFDSDLFRV